VLAEQPFQRARLEVAPHGPRVTTKLNRKDFGLTWNKAIEAGGVVVGDGIELSLEVEFVKAPPAGAVKK
jgi:polyisoprenoid-binding protein YceI